MYSASVVEISVSLRSSETHSRNALEKHSRNPVQERASELRVHVNAVSLLAVVTGIISVKVKFKIKVGVLWTYDHAFIALS